MLLKFDSVIIVQAPAPALPAVSAALVSITGAYTVTPGTGVCPPWPAEDSSSVWACFNADVIDWVLLFDRLEAARIEGNQDTLFVLITTPDGFAAGGWGLGELETFKCWALPRVDRGTFLADWFDRFGCSPAGN